MVRSCLDGDDALLVPSLRRGTADWQQVLQGLATVYVHGASVDWAAFHKPYGRRRTELPTYAFDRRRFWLQAPPERRDALATGGVPLDQPLLDVRIDAPAPIFRARFGSGSPPFLFEHRLFDMPMVSAPV
jgi:acyl transferase domain-containing protein